MMSSDDLSNQMERILELMNQRASGAVDNRQVEMAVSKVLESLGSQPTAQKQTKLPAPKPSLKVDMGNYDDDDDDDEGDDDNQEAESTPIAQIPATHQLKYTEQDYRKLLEDIPMGRVGSQMMTAFGDGPQPDIESLKLALTGVRDGLQLIVMDARAVRRKVQAHYAQAQEQTRVRKTKRLDTLEAVDPSFVYRAILNEEAKAHDPLGKNRPCGFDVEQLKTLYPEEVRAYHRWNELHSEYHASADKKVKAEEEDEPGKSEGESLEREHTEIEAEEDNDDYLGGHLKERAATFDARTVDMENDNYLKFSRIRQGSFLPARQQRSSLELEWESIDPSRRGRGKEGSWIRMSAVSVRFLHWLGFDPPEKPPPDGETTQVLGFLGYDRMGRIIEKAIYLRHAEQHQDDGNQTDLRQRRLPEGCHLTTEDIRRALQDPDVKPQSLFSLEKKPQGLPNTQLYFGPGFEQRLELELEEMLAGSDGLRKEEDEIREGERDFFAKLSEPPKAVDGLRYLLSKHKGEILDANATAKGGDNAYMEGSDQDEVDAAETSDDDDTRRPSKRSRK